MGKRYLVIMLFEVIVSIYQRPGNPNQSLVVCSFDNKPDKVLIVKNKDLESKGIVDWFDKECH